MDCQSCCIAGSKIDQSAAANTTLLSIRGRLTRPRGLTPRRKRTAADRRPSRFRRTQVLKTQSTRSRLLASSVICGAAVLAGGQALAQDQGGNQVEEFV